MGNRIGILRGNKPIETYMREIKDWLERVGINKYEVSTQYDPRINIAKVEFKFKEKPYSFTSLKQDNCRRNMQAIAYVMEYKVRAHLMKVEEFSASMSPYLAIGGPSAESMGIQPVKQDIDAYAVLGISNLASNEELSLCYKRMAKAYHPDMAGSVEAKEVFTKKFTELSEAWEKIKVERRIG
jgi:hypothetical protein